MEALDKGTPVWVRREEPIPGTARHGGGLFDRWSTEDTRKWREKAVVLTTAADDKVRIYSQEKGCETVWRSQVLTLREREAEQQEQERVQARLQDRKQAEEEALAFARENGPEMFRKAWEPPAPRLDAQSKAQGGIPCRTRSKWRKP